MNCPICNKILKVRYDYAELIENCDELSIIYDVSNYTGRWYKREMPHYSKRIASNDLFSKSFNELFVIDNLLFFNNGIETDITDFKTLHKIMTLPKPLRPKDV